jgi:hypothetical protein
MTAFELLREIAARGIRVLVRGDRISLRAAVQQFVKNTARGPQSISEQKARCATERAAVARMIGSEYQRMAQR